MKKRFVHTPEGVRDIYGPEYTRKLAIEATLHTKFRSYGYQDIQTPTFEFFDVFSKEIGTTPSKELYKFFDKEGNTLVLRPDFTPSIARCAAKYFMEETLPVRFCYSGNTFTNTSNLQGKLKEVTQMGVELIGDASVEADAETISLVVDSLLAAGLKDFQVSIGDVEFFRGLCREAGLNADTELALRDLISEKNYFGAEDLLIQEKIPENYRESLLKVTELFGNYEAIEEAKKFVNNPVSEEALNRLEKLYERLKTYQADKYISFDLGILSKYNYYTGVIFKAYTYGIGDAIVKGGRYDSLLEKFGKASPAIGFVIVVDDVLEALSRQNIEIDIQTNDTLVVYSDATFDAALKKSRELREKGICVTLLSYNRNQGTESDETVCETYAKNNCFSRILFIEENGIKEILITTGRMEENWHE
ncbi:MAG: ATP phosphoribosyltransferase regulatory subunit [Lachnospiraceae bacterium]|nr:ATP phosphoribosyltransferase regulatory subunit [Lachnospiraceae bacterium]